VAAWLTDSRLRGGVATAALRTVEDLGGALDRTLAAIDPYLMQFRLEHG
jgi:3-deoxy-D-manno-octulosonic-acid transferase